jgi:serine/threonine protein kinase
VSDLPPRRGNERDLVPPTLAAGGESAAPTSGDSLVGTVLGGRYRILRRLGEGAMGNVYLGEHLKIGRQDAIKVLRDNLASDPDTIARFLRGTRNVSAIRHPNVCTIYDFCDTDDGLQFVAMEYVPGETLKDLLQRVGVLPLERAVDIAAQAADALDAAHAAGIVHRDLKPANIMVMQSRVGADEVKVVDFDISKVDGDGEEEEVTRLGFVVGTPEYMSPEQLVGERLDGRSDTYSLALVLFRMVTGRLPFDAEGPQEVMIKRLTEQPMLLSEAKPGAMYPEALERALHQALTRKPQERQATSREFSREIRAAVASAAPPVAQAPAALPRREESGRAAESTPPKQPPSAVETLWRRWRTKTLAAAGVMVAGVGGAMLMMNMGDGEPEGADPPVGQVATIVSDSLATSPEQDPPSGGTLTSASEPIPSPEREPTAVGPSEPEAGGTPSPPEVVSSNPPLLMTAAVAEETLWRLFDRIGEEPGRAALAAARDTARLVWDLPAAGPQQRAFAAYIVGSALFPLGDTAGAVTWLERAVQLNPDGPGYRPLLDRYRDLLSN